MPDFEPFFPFRLARNYRRWLPSFRYYEGEKGLSLTQGGPWPWYQDVAGSVIANRPGDPVGLWKDRSGLGNHASQATALSKPRLGRHPASGLRNRANGAQAVDTVAWGSGGVSNGLTYTKVGTGTEGGLPYVDIRMTGTATASQHAVGWSSANSRIPMTSGFAVASVTARVIAGAPPTGATQNGIRLQVFELDATFAILTAGASNGITASVDTTITLSRGATAVGVAYTSAFLVLEGGATEVIDVTYRIKGLQFEVGSTPTALQHNLSPYDITEPGYADVWYLAFDGVDDYLATPVINWVTDEVTVVYVARKNSDAAEGRLVQYGDTTTNGSWTVGLSGPPGNAPIVYGYHASRGTITAYTGISSSMTQYAAPLSVVGSMRAKISTDMLESRINGVTLPINAGLDQGSGTYASRQLLIGRSPSAYGPFSGRIYGLFAINRVLSPSELARVERYMARLAGVTIP